jgi:polyhydroxybutyrate depolymerase
LAFHGAGGSGRFMEHYSGLDREASRLGAITVYPDAKGRTWNLEDEGGPADVTFIRALLDKVAAEQCVDSSRIWAAGVSNGGGFTARLACVMADRLSAAVVVAGGFGALPECHPARPVSVLEIHGKGDRVVPYDGDARTSYRGAVLPWVRSWVKHDGCEARHSRHTRINRRTVRLDWGPCENGTMVSHFAIVRGAHQWPGATPPDPGPRPTISAANETWRFLTSLRHARRVVP